MNHFEQFPGVAKQHAKKLAEGGNLSPGYRYKVSG